MKRSGLELCDAACRTDSFFFALNILVLISAAMLGTWKRKPGQSFPK